MGHMGKMLTNFTFLYNMHQCNAFQFGMKLQFHSLESLIFTLTITKLFFWKFTADLLQWWQRNSKIKYLLPWRDCFLLCVCASIVIALFSVTSLIAAGCSSVLFYFHIYSARFKMMWAEQTFPVKTNVLFFCLSENQLWHVQTYGKWLL